ncbi:MAG: hypothetical protein NVS3B5_08330 [Sphingomicrobium sp.]
MSMDAIGLSRLACHPPIGAEGQALMINFSSVNQTEWELRRDASSNDFSWSPVGIGFSACGMRRTSDAGQ